jgi:hypothetical protein
LKLNSQDKKTGATPHTFLILPEFYSQNIFCDKGRYLEENWIDEINYDEIRSVEGYLKT